MVKSITALGRTGLHDWLIQRVSALVMLFYVIYLGTFFCSHPVVTFADWQQFFSSGITQVATFTMVFAFVLHAWIGLWIVFTDYVKWSPLRLMLQIFVILLMFVLLVWTAQILWQ